MFKEAIKSFVRNFNKRRLIYSITIGGFAISMAILLLIIAFIIDEKSFDKSYANIDRIYRIKQTEGNIRIPQKALKRVLEEIPEVESMAIFKPDELIYEYNKEKQKADFIQVSTMYFDIFSVNVLQGIIPEEFDAKSDVILTNEFAKRLMGNENPIGQVIDIESKGPRTIIAVVEIPKGNTSISYDAMVCIDHDLSVSTWCNNDDCYHLYSSALILNKHANFDNVTSKIAQQMDQYPMCDAEKIFLQPYKDIYFDTESIYDSHKHANVGLIKLLSWIALIIFVLAVLNYINLSTASNIERVKEVCVRKTSGAGNRHIVMQFLGESYIACLISMVVALVLLVFFSPLFMQILGREFQIVSVLMQQNTLVIVSIVFVFIGLLAGLYPAIMVAMYNPIQLVSNNSKTGKFNIRGVFNAFQFAVTIILIISLLVINRQLNFVKTKDFGFNTEHLLRVKLEGETNIHQAIIQDRLVEYPGVINATISDGSPFDIWMRGSGTFSVDGEEIRVQDVSHIRVAKSFVETFEMAIIEGRDFRATDKNVCIINKAFVEEVGWTDIENKNIWDNKVVGVVDDIHYEDMRKRIGKLCLQNTKPEDRLSDMSIRIRGENMHETMAYIKSVMREFDPYIHLDYQFYDDKINELYQTENNQAAAIRIYSLIAILLSCLGLFGMVEFASKKRMKEIGIRRVNGAKITDVLIMLNRDFTIWVIVAFIFACPLAYILMDKWLSSFVYKTELSWWVFLLAGIATLLVALVTVTWQSWQTSRQNPVESLRYE